MFDFTGRTELLIGCDAMRKLSEVKIAVIGIGGVGSAAAEALVRAGCRNLIIADSDEVDVSNINRQLIASHKNIGMRKVEAAQERYLDINPELSLTCLDIFFNEETAHFIFDLNPDYIIDAIDTVSSKLYLAAECQHRGINLISSLGTGNRLDPTAFKIGKIEDTAGCGCGLARVMRSECRKRGITSLDVLYSTEFPKDVIAESKNGRHSPASISFCPPAAGYIIAAEIVKRIIE